MSDRVGNIEFKDLALDELEADSSNPRLARSYEKSDARLFNSILKYGLQEPLLVTEVTPGRYRIIDGHRRYHCIKKLENNAEDFDFLHIPCRVRNGLSRGDKEVLRFEVQTNRRGWKPYEKSRAIYTIKTEKQLDDPKEIAALINISPTSIRAGIKMQQQAAFFLTLIGKYNLPESYVNELVRLTPKLVRIKNFEVRDIAGILFEKAHRKIIRSAKEFRRLAKIFMRFKSNENEINEFLGTPDMTIEELEIITNRSSLLLFAEKFFDELSNRTSVGSPIDSKEFEFFQELKMKLSELVPDQLS